MTKIEYDPAKRTKTLAERGLDMDRAGEVFDLPHLTVVDQRREYSEERFVTVGYLDDRMVVLAWTWRGRTIRVMSMRKANVREKKRFGDRLERP